MRKDFEKLFPILRQEIERNNLDKNIDLKLYHRTSLGSVLGFIQFTYRYPTFGITMSNIDIFPYYFRKSSEGINDTLYYKERFG